MAAEIEAVGQAVRQVTHPEHQLVHVSSIDEFTCDFCRVRARTGGNRMRCMECSLDFHDDCTSFPVSLPAVGFFADRGHQLHLQPYDSLRPCRLHCRVCQGRVRGAAYVCGPPDSCGFLMHPRCIHLPLTVEGDASHQLHPLHLVDSSCERRCNLCKDKCTGYRYQCSSVCRIDIHPRCLEKGVDTVRDERAAKKKKKKKLACCLLRCTFCV